MSGFIRRFTEQPSLEQLTQIEGTNIIDLPPPGSIVGVDSGIMCLVGEFADMTYAVAVDASGNITTDPVPVDVFTSADLINKLGGFDETIGQFGGDMGNGFVELRNKKFSRLVVVPVNLASAAGIRLWRDLPTNKSVTDPTPVVAVSAASVVAGREFTDSPDLLRIAQRILFSAAVPLVTGVDGDVTTAAAAATQTFDSPGSTFITNGVQEGDALVVGVIGEAGAPGSNADLGTLRVVSVDSETSLTVEVHDGTNFTFTTDAATVFRVHPASTHDTGGNHQFSEQAGYIVPARPITDGQGTGSAAADGTWVAGTLITPVVVPPAADASSADPLSGLSGAISPTTSFDYTAAIQAPNAPNDATIDALYDTAIDSLLEDNSPAREVNHVWAARKSNGIRTKLKSHALEASSVGTARTVSISPELDITLSTALATVLGDAAPGIGANRDERVFYDWPGLQTFVPEAVGYTISTADGFTTEDGILDTTSDGWLAALLSNLPPERNPGEATATVRKIMSRVLAFARNSPKLGINEYIEMRSKGIAGPRNDRVSGFIFQSGITSSLVSGEKNINRRRMADFIEDSLSLRYNQLAKGLLSESLKDIIITETDAFLSGLLSIDNPPAQRISDYEVDSISGNTPELEECGVFVIIVRVKTLATADFITLQAEIGEGVVITRTN